MVSSQQGSPGRRNSSSSGAALYTSLNTRIVPFISHYYSLLGDSPTSLIEIHRNDQSSYLKWQIPGNIFGTVPRIQGSTLLDNGLVSIKCYGYDSFSDVFSGVSAINCKIPVEIIDINNIADSIITVTIHGSVVCHTERYLFFQVFQIYENRESFQIGGNIFHIFHIPFDLQLSRSLMSQTTMNYNNNNDTKMGSQIPTNDITRNDFSVNCAPRKSDTSISLSHNVNNDVQTFPTYQDHKNTIKTKPQIKIHGLPLNANLTDKDILSAISFQLNNFNEGFAIAINRTKEKAVVQVDSFQSQDHLSQRGVYIKGIKYKVTVLNKKGGSTETKNGNKNQNKDSNNGSKKGQSGKPNNSKQKSENNKTNKKKEEPDNDGWITVRNKSKSR
ncbi:hypothetical protein FG386_001308 [Cryptosporidium ryanae]|uniref:uncharacterized protein n=1 Tax=Cryptosporidium ryanae TaxID=515981 RepID=UPI00351A0CF3|nr:hypothetical protein FG386_001308 [Cryptosporidium ryanae]